VVAKPSSTLLLIAVSLLMAAGYVPVQKRSTEAAARAARSRTVVISRWAAKLAPHRRRRRGTTARPARIL